jgi:hypothetical protein
VAAAVATASIPVADSVARTAISVTGVNGQPHEACVMNVTAPTIDLATPLA